MAARLSSLIPYDQRYFLPTQRVLARLDLEDGDLRLPAVHLPIAIQRCVTKLGTAHDCHVRCDKLTGDAWCSVLADYHCDIVRDYYSDNFYISTLGTEAVFVDGRAVRRPRLTPFEAAEKLRTRGIGNAKKWAGIGNSVYKMDNKKLRSAENVEILIFFPKNSKNSIFLVKNTKKIYNF